MRFDAEASICSAFDADDALFTLVMLYFADISILFCRLMRALLCAPPLARCRCHAFRRAIDKRAVQPCGR